MARGGRPSLGDRRPLPRGAFAGPRPDRGGLGSLSAGLAGRRRTPEPPQGSDRGPRRGLVAPGPCHPGDGPAARGAGSGPPRRVGGGLGDPRPPAAHAVAPQRPSSAQGAGDCRRRMLVETGKRRRRCDAVAAGGLRAAGRRRRSRRPGRGGRPDGGGGDAVQAARAGRTLRRPGLGHRGGLGPRRRPGPPRRLRQLLWRRRRGRRAQARGRRGQASRVRAGDGAQADRAGDRSGFRASGAVAAAGVPGGGPRL